MGITNYRVDKIDAAVGERKFEGVDVKNTFTVKKVTKPKMEKLLEVGWEFVSDYKKFGKISIAGTLIYYNDTLDGMFEEKDKKIVLKGEALREVSNFVLRRGIIEAVLIARTLQLPVPIQMPSVKVSDASGGAA